MAVSPISAVSFILILSFVINVKSSSSPFDVSFNFPRFTPDDFIGFANDATIKHGAIKLTKKNKTGFPLQHSVGQAAFLQPIRIYNKANGKVANFTTEFTFLVNRNSATNYGDGLAFFLMPPDFKLPDRKDSSGGFLGIFTHENTLINNDDNGHNKIVLVEFDSFNNEWDPIEAYEISHMGIDVGSIKSVATAPWLIEFEPDGTKVTARISYDSRAKRLSVNVFFHDKVADSSLVYDIDLTKVLPEAVFVGFTAATGDLVETHDILSWSFNSKF
ncbi:lectin 11-like [Arachis stenosperma]|uniref:lectin 11-like n=1 Tax=Arachis stenosperma TaxID=217475 RepID=UPI0025AC0231|nr:lectin 11-like [Arachis stenosperma]